MFIKRTTTSSSSNNNNLTRNHHISLKSLLPLVVLHIFQVLVADHCIVLSRPLESSSPLIGPTITLYEHNGRSQGNNDWHRQQPAQSPQPTTTNIVGTYNNNNIGPFLPNHAFKNNQVIRESRLGSLLSPATNNNINNGKLINKHHQQQQQQQQGRLWQPFQSTPSHLSSNNNHHLYNLSTIANHNDRSRSEFQASSLRKALLSLQNPRLLGGDILVRTNPNGRPRNGRLIKFERSALVSPISLWPNGVIFYELDPSVGHLNGLIWKVMQQFHESTCIRFIARENNEPDYLRIEALRGCFSYIGRIGGEQTLSLGDGCEYKGTISHELLHAVGFFHHQNRSDRDDHLEIVWENIAKGKENQFSKMAPHENILLNEFDYNSIMLYGPHTFGKTLDKVTMKPKREGVILLEVIEKQGLSALDIDSVNKLYKCEPLY